MHELAIANGVLERALEAATERGADTITALTLEVGTITHVNPTQLSNCLSLLAADTPMADAMIEIERIEPAGRCSCGWSGEPRTLEDFGGTTPDPRCPDCGAQLEFTAGRECRLASITVPDSTPTP